jgi:hypothetical protein
MQHKAFANGYVSENKAKEKEESQEERTKRSLTALGTALHTARVFMQPQNSGFELISRVEDAFHGN